MIIRHLIEALLNPFFLCMLGFTFFTFLLLRDYESRRIGWNLSIILIILFFLSTGWIPQWITGQLEGQYQPIMKIDPNIHWVVVFSGGQAEVSGMPVNSELYSSSIKRLVEGLRLYHQLPSAKLLLSGGGYKFEKPESMRLWEIARWLKIAKTDLIVEKSSLNTAEEAQAIKAYIHNAPFYLVTSALHMPRAMQLCIAEGLHPIAAPTDYSFYWHDKRWSKIYIPNPHNLMYLSEALHEILGRIWMKIDMTLHPKTG